MFKVCDQLFWGKLMQHFTFRRIKIENVHGLDFFSFGGRREGGCHRGAQPSAVPFRRLWTGVTEPSLTGPGEEVTVFSGQDRVLTTARERSRDGAPPSFSPDPT